MEVAARDRGQARVRDPRERLVAVDELEAVDRAAQLAPFGGEARGAAADELVQSDGDGVRCAERIRVVVGELETGYQQQAVQLTCALALGLDRRAVARLGTCVDGRPSRTVWSVTASTSKPERP